MTMPGALRSIADRNLSAVDLVTAEIRRAVLTGALPPGEQFSIRELAAERLGALFAVPAAVSVDNAKVLSEAHNYAEQMQAAAASHAIIDQAIGVMISRSGSTDAEALEALWAEAKLAEGKTI